MKTIEELRRQIESYQEVLSVVKRPYRSVQDEVAAQLVSRMLFDTTNELKSREQKSVKIHRSFEMDNVPMPEFNVQRGRLVPSRYRNDR